MLTWNRKITKLRYGWLEVAFGGSCNVKRENVLFFQDRIIENSLEIALNKTLFRL